MRVAALLVLAAMSLGVPSHSKAEELLLRLPAFARSINYDEKSGLLAASMALEGTAFVTVPPQGRGAAGDVETHPEWPSLDALAVGNDTFLLAGRFGELRLVARGKNGRFAELKSWKAEGIPTDITRHGNSLFVAAGGSGVLLYEWTGGTDDPVLRGRYPFVDYSKELAMSEGGILYVADNFDTGMQVLDVSDIERPKAVASVAADFADGVARNGAVVAVAGRRVGTYLFDVSDPSKPVQAAIIPGLPGRGADIPDVKSVAIDGNGRLVMCENKAGARLFQLSRDAGGLGFTQTAKFTAEGTAISEATFLPGGRLLLVANNGAIYVHD